MLKFNTFPPVEIALNKGLYLFTPLSATGKTRLAGLLQSLSDMGEPVVVYTYRDYLNKVDIASRVCETRCSLLFLDRYDMYNGDSAVVNTALQIAKTGIVLVDVKASEVPGFSGYRYADICMYQDRIEVYT